MVGHDTILRGLGARADKAPPLILQRTEDDAIGSTLEQLTTSNPLEAVAPTRADDRDAQKTLRLYQPVHRTFHLALLEVVCDQPGRPRLDPTKIDSAGMVIRRVARRGLGEAKFPQAWLSVGKKLRGWQSLPASDRDRDPEPLRRKIRSGGSAELAQRALEKARLVDGAEQVTPMFVAPPTVCSRAATTILYGLIPTASAEMSESSAPAIMPSDFDRQPGDTEKDDLRNVIPRFLRANENGMDLGGLAGLTFDMRAAAYLTATGEVVQSETDRRLLSEFLNFLKFLRASLDAFGGSPEALALRGLLAQLKLPATFEERDLGHGRAADEALAQAVIALTAQDPDDPASPQSFTMPVSWPPVSKSLAADIFAQIKKGLAARLSDAQPGVPRFDDPTARYQLRAFVRVRRDDGCPPELVWSEPSEPFSIVAWYENGVVPPIQIRLPDITSKMVRALKPNVAFRIPKRLFNFLNENDPKNLIDGKGKEGSEFGLEWICGFNISIIFVLAFIVMFIFLIILNIVFWWLPFIRICFPLPTFSRRDDT
jgi:hypothetical protein